MGIVYRARQRSLDRIVAVKLLLFGANSSPEYVKRFRTEASTTASLHHPNIVAIHEVGVQQGEHYLVMDLVDGPNLASLVKDRPLSPNRAAGYLKIIAEAIHYAHQRGILHRDLKPSNVLIDANDQPRVTDFGLARQLEKDSSLTLTGQVLGSPSYMPPEQARANSRAVDRRSDVYSLGAMLYHVLVGRPPFSGGDLNQTLDQLFNREPISPRLLNPAVPRDLETICLKCLEKEPGRRYSSAQALADELGRFLRDEPIHSRPVSSAEKLWRWCRRKPALATLVVLLHLVAGAGLAGVLWELREAKQNLHLMNLHLAIEALEDHDLPRTRALLRAMGDSQVLRSKSEWEWRYLTGRSVGDQESILDRQAYRVWGITLSSNAQWLASINDAGQVKLWDFANRRERTNWIAHIGSPDAHAVAFLPGSNLLITAGTDKWVRLWEVPSGRKLSELELPEEPIGRLAVSRDGQMLAGGSVGGHRIALLSLVASPPSLLREWSSGLTVLYDVALAPDNLTVFAGGPSGQSVQRFDLADPAHPQRMPSLEDSDGPVAISPDGRWLAGARTDGQPFRVWALPALTPVSTNYVRGSRLYSLKFSPNSEVLAAGLEDGRILIWNMSGTREPTTLLGHERQVLQMDFSPDGTTLVSASWDKTIRVWDLTTGECAKWSFSVGSRVHDVNFSPDSKRLVSASQINVRSGTDDSRKCLVQLWDVDDRKGLVPSAVITNKGDGLNYHVCFSRNGKLVAADDYETLNFYQASDLTRVTETGSRLPCWAPNADWLTYVEHDRLVRVDSPSAPATTLANGSIVASALSPNGSILASASLHGVVDIELRDSRTGELLGQAPRAHGGFVTWLAFSRDGKTLASAGWGDGWLRIWDVSSRGLLPLRKQLRGNNGAFYKLAFSPDGATLATCGSDDKVRLWNVTRLQEVAVLQGHRGPVNSVAFSPDGRWLASGSSDGTIRLWWAPTTEEIAAEQKSAGTSP
jgi:WD40 repeat protein